MVELRRDQVPALVFAADDVFDRNSHVVVVDRVYVVLAERMHRRDLNALRVSGNNHDRNPFVGRRIGVGSASEPHIVGVIGEARPDLLAVD